MTVQRAAAGSAERSVVVTVTPNPSIDLLFEADRLVWDDANRVDAPRRRPGGQGINVARAVRALGGTATGIAPVGGETGRELARSLEAEGTPLHAVPIAGETRVFVGARERETGHSLLLNPRGPMLSDDECAALFAATEAAISAARPGWVACCGSVAPGLPADFYASVGELAAEHGAKFVPDCDGEPLRLAAAAGCDLLVPNVHEAERLLGRAIDDLAAAGRAATELLRFGPALAVITLGADGAVAASANGAWHVGGPRLDQGSAVGAGDALLAGLILALEGGADPVDAVRAGVAAGTAVLLASGDAMLRPDDLPALIERTTVRKLA